MLRGSQKRRGSPNLPITGIEAGTGLGFVGFEPRRRLAAQPVGCRVAWVLRGNDGADRRDRGPCRSACSRPPPRHDLVPPGRVEETYPKWNATDHAPNRGSFGGEMVVIFRAGSGVPDR